jgi:hypothetical protein
MPKVLTPSTTSPTPPCVAVLVATRKGVWIFHSDTKRKTRAVDGPHFLGRVVYPHVTAGAVSLQRWWH